mgnify:CR=1 FL=1
MILALLFRAQASNEFRAANPDGRGATLQAIGVLDTDADPGHHGAIPGSAMKSPGQFNHPLIARAKCEISAAALACGIVPSHNVTTELKDIDYIRNDALRARREFGYLRMWSIKKFAAEFGSDITIPVDVSSDEQIDALFVELAKRWDGLDGLVHSIAYAPTEAIEGDFLNVRCAQGFGQRGGLVLRMTGEDEIGCRRQDRETLCL